MADFRAELAALVTAYDEHGGKWPQHHEEALWQAVEHARAVLTQPEPAPAADGEVAELATWLYELAAERTCNRRRGIRPHPSNLTRAAVLLERQAMRPIPVSERLPGTEDCLPWPGEPDVDPWCWLGSNVDDGWEWEQRSAKSLSYWSDFTHWLPAHALPLPEVE